MTELSLGNLTADGRARERMVRAMDALDADASDLSVMDKAQAVELSGYATRWVAALVAMRLEDLADPFAVRGAVLRQMLADYDREREAMEAQDAAAETDR